jgi:hypothetical protein
MTRSRKVLWVGWLLFVIAQFLPAVVIDLGAWNRPEHSYAPGWACTLIAWPFYPSNLLMLCSPILVRVKAIQANPWTRFAIAALLLASLIGAMLSASLFSKIHAGYVLWVCSFAVVAAAVCMNGSPIIQPMHESG